jgi:competence protein ComEA
MNKVRVILLCALLACLVSGCGERELSISTVGEEAENSTETIQNDSTEDETLTAAEDTEDTETDQVKSDICVYVCGAVMTEGVYNLPAGSIKADALEAAGGYAEDAVRGYVNLAQEAVDGEKIYFPRQDEVTSSYESEAGAGTGQCDGRINLNTASQEELMTLPGVGESKARAIIEYREEHQGFQSIEEIMNINGIKEGVYNNIKDLITI